jgi:hypothetical protein
VYELFRRWQRDGASAQILAGMLTQADATGLIGWEVKPSLLPAQDTPPLVSLRNSPSSRRSAE